MKAWARVYRSKGKFARQAEAERLRHTAEKKAAKAARKKLSDAKKPKYRACTRKKKYATREAARCKGFRVYVCPYCEGFHRTTSKAAKLARKEKEF